MSCESSSWPLAMRRSPSRDDGIGLLAPGVEFKSLDRCQRNVASFPFADDFLVRVPYLSFPPKGLMGRHLCSQCFL